jgi:hypothetical protein
MWIASKLTPEFASKCNLYLCSHTEYNVVPTLLSPHIFIFCLICFLFFYVNFNVAFEILAGDSEGLGCSNGVQSCLGNDHHRHASNSTPPGNFTTDTMIILKIKWTPHDQHPQHDLRKKQRQFRKQLQSAVNLAKDVTVDI